jgi:hypothetical protein
MKGRRVAFSNNARRPSQGQVSESPLMRWSAAESSSELKKIVLAGSRMIIDMPIRSIGRVRLVGDGLWSIDLPPVDRFRRQQVGPAVGDPYADRWTASRVRKGNASCFSSLARSIFSFTTACTVNATHVSIWIEPGRPWHRRGALGVDDVDGNWGFRSFNLAFPGQQSMIGESEPLRLNLRRFNKKGLFGIILKQPAAHGSTAVAGSSPHRRERCPGTQRDSLVSFVGNQSY